MYTDMYINPHIFVNRHTYTDAHTASVYVCLFTNAGSVTARTYYQTFVKADEKKLRRILPRENLHFCPCTLHH